MHKEILSGPQTYEHSVCGDIGKVAKRYPDVNSLIYRSGAIAQAPGYREITPELRAKVFGLNTMRSYHISFEEMKWRTARDRIAHARPDIELIRVRTSARMVRGPAASFSIFRREMADSGLDLKRNAGV